MRLYMDIETHIDGLATYIEAFSRSVEIDVARDLFLGLVASSPVDTGELRAGWSVSYGSPGKFRPPHIPKPAGWKKGNPPLHAIPVVPTFSQSGGKIFIYNNVPHLIYQNYGTDRLPPLYFVEGEIEKVRRKYAGM